MTPMQELIKHFTKAWDLGDLWKPDLVIDKIESMIEKERQFAKDNFEAGAKFASAFHPLAERKDKAPDFETYYKQFETGASVPKSQTKHYEWQLCPKCNGDGNLLRYNSPNSTTIIPICDVCYGAKIIPKPFI